MNKGLSLKWLINENQGTCLLLHSLIPLILQGDKSARKTCTKMLGIKLNLREINFVNPLSKND